MGKDNLENLLKTSGISDASDLPQNVLVENINYDRNPHYLTEKNIENAIETIDNVPNDFAKLRLYNAASQYSVIRDDPDMDKSIREKIDLAIDEAEKMSVKDSMTGVYNRNHFNKMIRKEKHLAERHSDHMYSLIMIDLDNFKQINDVYGHLAGDDVLRAVGKCLRKNEREEDNIYRYGGEEFVILLQNTKIEEALVAAERIRSEISDLVVNTIDNDGNEIKKKITASIGVSGNVRYENDSDVLRWTDVALYHSKKNGKNCVSYIKEGSLKKYTSNII